jgi:hypothetical protein
VGQLLEDAVDVHHGECFNFNAIGASCPRDSPFCMRRAIPPLFERAHAVAQRVDVLERGGVLLPAAVVVDGEKARVVARLEDGARDHGGRGDVHVVGNRQMPQDHARAAHRAVAPMRALPATPTQPAMAVCLPMWHVVADLDQVVELDAVLDHRVVQRAAVDAGVGADLHVVADAHRAQLLDRSQRPASGAKPKPSPPITAPLWIRPRAPTQSSPTVTRAFSTVPAPMRAPRRPAQRADAGAGVDVGALLHHGAGMHAGSRGAAVRAATAG